MISACPLCAEIDQLRRLEEAGAAAAVLPSLFEEQIEHEAEELGKVYEFHTDSFAESLTYFPEQEDYRTGPEQYLETIAAAKKAVKIPVIASLNGSSRGGWIRYARMMQDAGADALELNVYFVAADADMTGRDVESRYLEVVAAVKESISIPLAVKVGPYFSRDGQHGPAALRGRGGRAGAVQPLLPAGHRPGALEARPQLHLSTPGELAVPLRWIAILHGRTSASLAATGGIHDAAGLAKALLAGADVGMVASVLFQKGVAEVGRILAGLREWMDEKEYDSVEQLEGSMSLENSPDPAAYQRGNYMKTLTSYVGKAI